MIRRLLVALISAASVLFTPVLALAQDEDEGEKYDARLEGYGPSATLDDSSTALMWLLLILLAAMCVGVMFKNARRTHLD